MPSCKEEQIAETDNTMVLSVSANSYKQTYVRLEVHVFWLAPLCHVAAEHMFV